MTAPPLVPAHPEYSEQQRADYWQGVRDGQRGAAPERRGVGTLLLQDTVFCAGCRAYQYNASRVETGRAPRSVSTVHRAIRPKQRMRVIERSSGRCELCGAAGVLHVAHLLSVEDGIAAGLTDSEINCDENLCALCEECNLGLGALSVSPRLYIALLRRRAM